MKNEWQPKPSSCSNSKSQQKMSGQNLWPAHHEWESPVVCFAHLGRKGGTIINLVMVRNGWNTRVKLGYLRWHQLGYLRDTPFFLCGFISGVFWMPERSKRHAETNLAPSVPPQPKFPCTSWIGNNCWIWVPWNTGKNQRVFGFSTYFSPKMVLYLGFV